MDDNTRYFPVYYPQALENGQVAIKSIQNNFEVEPTQSTPAESVLRYEVCGDSLPIVYNGEAYGEGEHVIVLRSAQGCDSVLRL